MGAIKKILLVAVPLALMGLAWGFRDHIRVEILLAPIRALGPWGPLAFIVLYGIAPPLFLPGFPLTLAGGALFGPVWGTLYSLVGATGGATLAFFIARYLAGDWVEERTKGIAKRLKEGGAAAYSFIGYAGRESAVGGEGLVFKIGAALGLLVFVSIVPRLIRRVRGQHP